MNRLIMLLFMVGLISFVPVGASAQICDSLLFEVSAEVTNDPGFEGMYKYTISGYWEVSGPEQGWGLSYIIFSLGTQCPCLCDSEAGEVVEFPDPAGTSTGVDNQTEEPCEIVYLGSLECNGLEDITTDIVVKFEVPDNQSCEPIHYGTGTWFFYSTLAPLTGDYIDAIIIKYGEMLCEGVHFCDVPNCYECVSVPTEKSSWGSIKFIFK